MKTLYLCMVFMLFTTIASAAGLGSTFTEFEQQWGKGYKQVYDQGGGLKDIHIGSDKKHSIYYSTGSDDFAGRVGNITGELWGMFGASYDDLPTKKQFFSGIKAMMSPDSRLIGKYQGKLGDVKREIYVYKSAALAKTPDINKSLNYKYEPSSRGKFFLVVNYNTYDNKQIMLFHLFLGDGQNDIGDMKKVKAQI